MHERRWDAAAQSGRASLMTTEQLDTSTEIYSLLSALEAAEADEQMLWAQLRALEGQQRLSQESIFAMRTALSQARLANWRIKLTHAQAFDLAQAGGIKPITTRRGSRSVCIPMDTPRTVALTQIQSKYGEP